MMHLKVQEKLENHIHRDCLKETTYDYVNIDGVVYNTQDEYADAYSALTLDLLRDHDIKDLFSTDRAASLKNLIHHNERVHHHALKRVGEEDIDVIDIKELVHEKKVMNPIIINRSESYVKQEAWEKYPGIDFLLGRGFENPADMSTTKFDAYLNSLLLDDGPDGSISLYE
jgi:hypothetical protein